MLYLYSYVLSGNPEEPDFIFAGYVLTSDPLESNRIFEMLRIT